MRSMAKSIAAPGETLLMIDISAGPFMCSPPKKASLYFWVQVHVPLFLNVHTLRKVSPGLMMVLSGMVASWTNMARSIQAAGLVVAAVSGGGAAELAVGVVGWAGCVSRSAWVRITSTVRAACVAGPGGCEVGWVGKLQPTSEMSIIRNIGRKNVLRVFMPKLSLLNL
jgi:hypothetical protein